MAPAGTSVGIIDAIFVDAVGTTGPPPSGTGDATGGIAGGDALGATDDGSGEDRDVVAFWDFTCAWDLVLDWDPGFWDFAVGVVHPVDRGLGADLGGVDVVVILSLSVGGG